jgi:vacuolar protein sorting-associated protein 54
LVEQSARGGAGAAQEPAQERSGPAGWVGRGGGRCCPNATRRPALQVLGAGAMRTAGLKSISAKHLALAAQSLAALLAALPLLRWQLAAAISDAARRALLMPEFDRLAQVGFERDWGVGALLSL